MNEERIIQFLGLMYWNFADEDYITVDGKRGSKEYKRLFRKLYVVCLD